MNEKDMQNIWNTLTVNLKTYCDEYGFSDVALGLSGGLDSALVSVLAADALGAEHVYTFMMKTNYTSDLSLQIAAKIAELNGFHYQTVDIQPIIDNQKRFLTSLFGQEPKSIVLENLQARERGKILMAYSNQFGALVLACGNKSECAMGYCTLYGDLCGGLMPLGDLYKSQIFELAQWRNQKSEVLPEAVIKRAPSAELRAEQFDEEILPPYLILDGILRAYIDEGKSLVQIIKEGFPENTAKDIVRQYHRMAFKREQMPRILKI